MISLHAFEEDRAAAQGLATELACRLATISTHRFPDGETLPIVAHVDRLPILYRSLNDPNHKVVETLLAADALRRAGAERVTLVAPYMPFLRQDRVFLPGQPLSRDVILPLLASAFETIVTVDPHLHRTARLQDVSADTHWIVLSGAEAIARGLKANETRAFDVIVGPDAESLQWVSVVARALALPAWTFNKRRQSDQEVSLEVPPDAKTKGARALLVDDVCSSGGTLLAAARALKAMGALHVEGVVTHALFGTSTAQSLTEAGVARLRSCDGCVHPTNAFALAPFIASAIRKELSA